ncbi:MAG: pitrilysin family protein, partial [Planctomycetota bacterium]|nr:pitrilysin family protein [Planctomycetota bacterium]
MSRTDRTVCLGLGLFIGALALMMTTACREWRKRHHELVAASKRGPEFPRELKFERIKVTLPDVEWVDMPNGAVLCLLPSSPESNGSRPGQNADCAPANQGKPFGAVPLVHVTARVFAGSVCDRPESKGLANVTAEAIRLGGSRSLTGEALAEEIEFLGADLGVSVSEEWVDFSISGHSRHCRRFLQMLTGLIFDPALPADKLDLCKGLLAETFRRENDRPGDIAQREFMRQIFPDHPYGWRTVGDAETVKAIEMDQVAAFHKRNYTPARLLVGIAGDFDAESVRNELRALLPTGVIGEAESDFIPRVPAAEPAPGAGIVAAAYRKLPQTSIALGHPGVERKHPDYFKLTVLNALLGGATSRLRDRVRTKLGLTYAISGRFSFMSVAGYFSVSTSTKT